MKKILVITSLVLVGCNSEINVKYQDTLNGACMYSEDYKPRKSLFDFFGIHDEYLSVLYEGVTCKKIIEKELQDETHKKPYNSVPVINEMPPLEIEVNRE